MTVFYLHQFPLPISLLVSRSSWHSAILVLPRVTPTYFLAETPLYCADEIMDDMSSFVASMYSLSLSHTLPVKCQGLGRPLLCGCRRQGAGALMWNSLGGETRKKLISLPGMRSLDTASPTIHPSSITSAFIFPSPHVSCAWILSLLVSQHSRCKRVSLDVHHLLFLFRLFPLSLLWSRYCKY